MYSLTNKTNEIHIEPNWVTDQNKRDEKLSRRQQQSTITLCGSGILITIRHLEPREDIANITCKHCLKLWKKGRR
jgi:hypothetical protein